MLSPVKVSELADRILKRKTFLCVGLDSDPNLMPAGIGKSPRGVLEFNRQIISACSSSAIAYKINLAFYEALGKEGWEIFLETVSCIRASDPQSFIIADAKRGDIGNTAHQYARAFFEEAGVDAITVAPYMGEDSIRPFLEYPDKVTIVLGLTSNAGHRDFQLLDCGGRPLYAHVLEKCMQWGSEEQLMFVIGATRVSLLEEVRKITGSYFWLVPGVGAQGGTLDEVWKGRSEKVGLIVNSSRDIIYNSKFTNFATAAADRAHQIQQQMARLLETREQ
jgi:orotidine-5'-phosphate decarboxylase